MLNNNDIQNKQTPYLYYKPPDPSDLKMFQISHNANCDNPNPGHDPGHDYDPNPEHDP